MASNFFKDIGDELADFIAWCKKSLENEAIRKSIAEDLGFEPGQSIGAPPPQDLTNVNSYRSKSNPDKEAFVALVNEIKSFYDSIRTMISGFGETDITRINSIVYLIFDMLASNYARLYLPKAYALIQALSTIVENYYNLEDEPFAVERFFRAIARAEEFVFSPIGYTFLSLTEGVKDEARATKMSNKIFPPLATFLLLAKTFTGNERLATQDVIYGWDTLEAHPETASNGNGGPPRTIAADKISTRMLSLAYPLSQPTSNGGFAEKLGMTLAIVPKEHADKPGLQIGLSGTGGGEFQLSDLWKIAFQANATPALSMLLKAEGGIPGFGANPPTGIPLHVAMMTTPDESDVTWALPDREETRIEIGQLAFSVSINAENTAIKAQALRCALVIATKDQDGFLSKILPKEGLRIPFSFGIGFQAHKGFTTEGKIDWPVGHASIPVGGSSSTAPAGDPVSSSNGSGGMMAALSGESISSNGSGVAMPSAASATSSTGSNNGTPTIPNLTNSFKPELGLQARIPIGKSLLNVKLDSLVLGISPSQDPSSPEARVETSVSLTTKLGPVTVIVDRIGLEFGLSFPESGGNLGFADLSLGFKPPSGAGIKIDHPAVSGGGFLFFDPKKGQYAGVVQIDIKNKLTLKGIGILATKLPNGEKGFSFVVMITAEGFTPIPLGLGFTLTGIGGLLAINRTCNEEFLREGIKNKTLDHLLFPKDPVRDAVQVFGTLNKAFPAQPGSYLFGPVLQIQWRRIIKMELGLLLELGNRTRLLILGKISVKLPTEKNDLIRLQMNALGVIDFDQSSISLDAILFDSRLAGKFPITGSMAMRLNWGSQPQFALSIGGFHPAFKPPANFPTLERLAITFSNSKSYRLRAESYFAVTSNTLQWGARMELYVEFRGFSLEGILAYDVLIQFSPFGFIAGFLLSVHIKRGSRNLFKLKLEGELTGPKPLHLKGKVTFEILWIDITINIDKVLIEGARPPALEPVAVMSHLVAALQNPANWSGQLAENYRRMVTVRELTAPNQIALHPMGRLSVKQDVVPLDLEISKFGDSTPSDGRLFKVESVSVNGNNVSFNRVKDFFAPSQFLDLSDDDKLAAPSFEPMVAGVSLGSESFLFTTNDEDLLEEPALSFETIVIDRENNETREAPEALVTPDLLDRQILLGAAARSDIRRSGTDRYRSSVVKNRLTAKGWTLASTADGSAQAAPGLEEGDIVSYSESFQALQQLKKQNPNLAKSLMLVRVNNE